MPKQIKPAGRALLITPIQALLTGIGWELASCVEDTVLLVLRLWKLFPNVYQMADEIARFSTSLLGRVLAAPFRGYAESYAQAVEQVYGSRLITPANAVRLAFRAPTEFLQAITFTDESGIVAVVVGGLARSIWRLFKRVKLLTLLLRVRTEEEFVRLVVSQLKRKGGVIKWIVIIGGILAVESLICLAVLAAGFALIMLEPSKVEDLLLPQNSKRVWSRKGRVVRQNRRRGAD